MIQSTSSSSPTLAATRADADKAKLKSAAQAFEAVFLRQMIGSMRSASLGDGMLDNEATSQFQDMADSKTADAMSQKGVLHLADLLVKQLGPIAAKGDGATPTPAEAAAQAETAANVTKLNKPKPDVTSLEVPEADVSALPVKADVTSLTAHKALITRLAGAGR
ncbi:rod-binding protein [Sphingomonas abietis]|uniref:rod-binding protein n=1 Tax=Sphingomonas abietis TaxID=3012344 RepID=UPI00389A1FFB